MWIPRRSSLVLLDPGAAGGPRQRRHPHRSCRPLPPQPGLKALAADYTAKTGAVVTVGGGSRANVLAALKAGPADVVVLPTNDLIELNTVSGMTPLGHIAVGVGVKAGSKVPGRLHAGEIPRRPAQGQGRRLCRSGRRHLGRQDDRQHARPPDFRGVKRVPVQGLAVTALADGRADIALQLAPELANDKAVALAGPVPDMYGAAVDFSVGIAAVTQQCRGGARFHQLHHRSRQRQALAGQWPDTAVPLMTALHIFSAGCLNKSC